MNRLSKQTAILLGLQLAQGAVAAERVIDSSFDQEDPDLAETGFLNYQGKDNEVFGTSGSGFTAPNYIFTTLSSGIGDLSQWPDAGGAAGIAAGDAICQAEAAAAGMPGAAEYIAWLSDSTADAYCRAHGFDDTITNNCGQASLPDDAGPWRRLDDRFFGGKLPDVLELGTPVRPIEFAPDTSSPGAFLTRLSQAYTGTTASGFFGGQNCSDWSADNGVASPGNSVISTANWAGANQLFPACSTNLPLICLRPGRFPGGPLPPTPEISRRVFVTSSGGVGDLSQWADAQGAQGVQAGDNICQAHAQRAGLENSDGYKAWLSDAAMGPVDRFSTSAPLLTIDGNRFTFSPESLIQSFPDAALLRDENGTFVNSFFRAWTGTGNDGIPTTLDCNGWQSMSAALSGTTGQIGTSLQWSSDSFSNCDAARRLYCFADFDDEILFGASFEESDTFTP